MLGASGRRNACVSVASNCGRLAVSGASQWLEELAEAAGNTENPGLAGLKRSRAGHVGVRTTGRSLSGLSVGPSNAGGVTHRGL